MSKIITVPFTEDFLPHVVEYIYRHYEEKDHDLSRLCLVFGGRRPALFIKRDLARRIGKAFIPPRFFTIDEWMAYVAYGTEVPAQGSDLDHCYTIYQLAMDLCPWVCRGREVFAQFLPWAREILHFIEQLDIEDVPLDSLKIIQEHAEIGFSVPADINKLLMHLGTLRGAYHNELERRELAPRGFQYRQAVRRVGARDLSPFDEILFCNFFYLHRTENTVIKNIYDRGQAVLLMQGDERRWPALLRIAKTFGSPILEGKEVKPTVFDLKIYEAFDAHAQAGLIKGIIDGISDYESTVIVLPDGDFLSTLLTAVGSDLEEFNVSMGYPLKRSALYTLLTLLIEAQGRRRGGLYYTRDYLSLLGHPLVKNLDLDAHQKGIIRLLVAKTEEVLKGELLTDLSGRLFLDPDDIVLDEKLLDAVIQSSTAMGMVVSKGELHKITRRIHDVFLKSFENIHSAGDLAAALHGFVEFMQANSHMDNYPFNAQIAFRMQEIGDELKICAFSAEVFESRDLFKILEERLSTQMVAFSGSPLRGLQILGLFETRALNFKNVIVVDVNEGFLPSLNIYEPLIPREVLIKLNLDRLELEEEIQRYGFMRLISGAQNVHLIYQQNKDRVRSRFLEELIWEQEKQVGIGAVAIISGAFDVSVDKKQRAIPKTAAMVDFLKSFRFSATSINAYLQNPYSFYCRYVLGLRTTDDLLEDPESRHIGVFVHDLLQETFGGFIKKKPVLDEQFRKYFQKIYESRFAEFFGRQKRSDTFLMETVLKTRLARFLDQEALRCETDVKQVLYVERKFEDVISLGEKKMHLTYRVDRVDEMTDGTILILDYKTGSMDPMPKDVLVDAVLTREYIRDHIKSFQMPLYVHYLRKQFPGREVNSILYHLRTMGIEKFLSTAQMTDVEKILDSYLRALDFVVAEIYNLEIPFIDDPVDIR